MRALNALLALRFSILLTLLTIGCGGLDTSEQGNGTKIEANGGLTAEPMSALPTATFELRLDRNDVAAWAPISNHFRVDDEGFSAGMLIQLGTIENLARKFHEAKLVLADSETVLTADEFCWINIVFDPDSIPIKPGDALYLMPSTATPSCFDNLPDDLTEDLKACLRTRRLHARMAKVTNIVTLWPGDRELVATIHPPDESHRRAGTYRIEGAPRIDVYTAELDANGDVQALVLQKTYAPGEVKQVELIASEAIVPESGTRLDPPFGGGNGP